MGNRSNTHLSSKSAAYKFASIVVLTFNKIVIKYKLIAWRACYT